MIEVDLLPEHLRAPGGSDAPDGARGRARGGLDLWGIVLLVAALTILPGTALLWWTQRSEAAALHARREAASADSARLAGLRGASDSLAARVRQTRERIALVERLDRDRFAWPRMLDEISWALPRLAWLSSLRQLTPPPAATVELQGIAANPLAITRFARNLDASAYIADVRILGSQQRGAPSEEPAQHAFTLVLRFDEAPSPRPAAPTTESPGG